MKGSRTNDIIQYDSSMLALWSVYKLRVECTHRQQFVVYKMN